MENQISPFWISLKNTFVLILQCVMAILSPWHHHEALPADAVHSRCSSRTAFCLICHIKSDRNPGLASEHDGTWNKDLALIKNFGIKWRHEVNYFNKVKQKTFRKKGWLVKKIAIQVSVNLSRKLTLTINQEFYQLYIAWIANVIRFKGFILHCS